MANTCKKNGIDWPATLREFRARHGLSQRGLAEAIPTSRRNIENWEAGISSPDDGLLTRALRDLASNLPRRSEDL